MTAAQAAAGHATIAITSAGFLADLDQALLRLGFGDLIERRDSDISRRWS